jgi:hypothetical protein
VARAPLTDRLRAWSRRRQRLGDPAARPLDALRAAVAVYSAHPSGPLTLLARSGPFSAREFGAMERKKRAVRVVGMRGSAFLVPAENAARIFSAVRRPDQVAARLRALGLSSSQYQRLKPRILEAASEPIAPKELERALNADRSAVFAMRTMAREGLILRIGWGDQVRTDRLRWVATQAWLGHDLEADAHESLAWLASAYLELFGPARVADFAWWAGVPRRRAADAVASVQTVEVDDGLLLPAALEVAWKAADRVDPKAVDVLPKWDCYTMGYAPDGRARFVADEHLPLAFSTGTTKVGATSGDGMPVILRGGRGVAAWSHRLEGDSMAVTVTPFPGVRLPAVKALEAAFEPVEALMDRTVAIQVNR